MQYIFGSKEKKLNAPAQKSGENIERVKANWFVGKKSNKDKRQLENRDLGLEYHTDVANDDDFYKKIIETDSYFHAKRPTSGNRNVGSQQSILGDITNKHSGQEPSFKAQTNKALIPELCCRLTSDVVAGEDENSLREYANRKLRYKSWNVADTSREELYIIKLKWLLRTLKNAQKEQKYNLNSFRMTIEKAITETSPAFEIQLFSDQKALTKILRQLCHFLAHLEPQKAILLSYKLFKLHLKQLNRSTIASRQEMAIHIYNVLLPYVNLMEIKEVHTKEKLQKKRTSLITYKKIKKFIESPEVVSILNEFPDPRKSPEYGQKLKNFLNEKISLEKILTELHSKDDYSNSFDQAVFSRASSQNVVSGNTRPNTSGSLEDLDAALGQAEGIHQDMEYENAMSMELDEKNNMKFPVNVDNYDFTRKVSDPPKNKPTLYTFEESKPIRTVIPPHLMQNAQDSDNDSELSSNEDSNESEVELMDDPDLYEPQKLSKKPSVKKANPHATDYPSKFSGANEKEKPLPKLIVNKPGDEPLITPGKIAIGAHRGRRESFARANEDIHTSANPNRVSLKLDLVRSNSTQQLASPNPAKEQNIPEPQAPKEEPAQDRAVLGPSICQKQYASTKTKKEITFQKILGIAYDEVSKWDNVINTPLIKIDKIKPENSPVVLLKCWAFIEGFTPKEIFDQIYDTQNRALWDTVTVGLKVVENIGHQSDIIYFYIKTPFGISERDFVQKRNFEFDYPEKDTIIMSFESCNHPSEPPRKNRVRGETHIAGYVIKPSTKKSGSTDLCIMSQVDIKGSVPKAIVNMVAGKAPAEWVNKLKKACENARAKAKKA